MPNARPAAATSPSPLRLALQLGPLAASLALSACDGGPSPLSGAAAVAPGASAQQVDPTAVSAAPGPGALPGSAEAAAQTSGSRVVHAARRVRLDLLSEAGGGPWAAIAELDLLDAAGAPLPRTGWTVQADSAEVQDPPAHAIDGNPASHWHTAWREHAPPPPHRLEVDLQATAMLSGFRVLPRQDGSANGNPGRYRFAVSRDGIAWATVAEGSLAPGPVRQARQVAFSAAPAGQRPPSLSLPAAQAHVLGAKVDLAIVAFDPDGDALAYAASGLPPGLAIDRSSGRITGAPTAAGRYMARISATDASRLAVSGVLEWTVRAPAGGPSAPVRFVRLESLSEVDGNPWAAIAEFELLDAEGQPLPRQGWRASADSSELGDPPSRAIDGRPETFWHTEWQARAPGPPHRLVIELPQPARVSGFRLLPRQDGLRNGTVARFRFHASADGADWGESLAEGDLRDLGPPQAEKTVRFGVDGGHAAGGAPVVVTPAAQRAVRGQATALAIEAYDPDGDRLAFGATGLPPGLALATDSGRIAGTPTLAGSFAPTVDVRDSSGRLSQVSFRWTVTAAAAAPRHARYVLLEQLSELHGNPWASIAEFNLLGANGAALPRGAWLVQADSAEPGAGAARAVDGDQRTQWHTQWSGAAPPPPHRFIVDLGTRTALRGFRVLPRQDGSTNGTIARYRFYLSDDGERWGEPVVEGEFGRDEAPDAERTVLLP